MLPLPPSSLTLIGNLPIPANLQHPFNHVLLEVAASFTSHFREFVPDLSKPHLWAKFRLFLAERCRALKITDFYTRYYENDHEAIFLLWATSLGRSLRDLITDTVKEMGCEEILSSSVEEADPAKLSELLERICRIVQNEFESDDPPDEDAAKIKAEAEHNWREIHPTLPPEEQAAAEQDAQLQFSLFMLLAHNILSVMAYRETLSSLVKRAVAAGPDADDAMCNAVRIDNNLREHAVFRERYLRACEASDQKFLRRFNDTRTPFTGKIKYPGLYFLLAQLDSFGLLSPLTDQQLLDLADRAELDRWENRIEDVGYLAKRRREYQQRKF